ncbi:hypothetical protein OG394_10870 [Kribbella sp. NBC_01245]|uniref:hypothetical protein n=1 Tax=Kribbella sp. NBC_01245 TaxID=2903578 RepID=UPI002E2A6D6B|nr:hypothetical protein [Kribbella sp. NBC_01245]
MSEEIWPVTIVPARYGGTYEPGPWLAFPNHPDALPIDWDAGDLLAGRYYAEHSQEMGAGMTPSEAYEDLKRIMQERSKRR